MQIARFVIRFDRWRERHSEDPPSFRAVALVRSAILLIIGKGLLLANACTVTCCSPTENAANDNEHCDEVSIPGSNSGVRRTPQKSQPYGSYAKRDSVARARKRSMMMSVGRRAHRTWLGDNW